MDKDFPDYERFRKLIFEDANRLILGLNALNLSNDIYSYLDDRISNGFISDAVMYLEMAFQDGKVSEDNFRAVMFVLSRIESLEEVA